MKTPARLLLPAVSSFLALLAACGGGGGGGLTLGGSGKSTATTAASTPAGAAAVAAYALKAGPCAAGSVPESALQGQVPAALRATGFQGFSCNLERVGQFAGEGGNWSGAVFRHFSGTTCAYHSTGSVRPNRQTPGVPVIDITDPARPVRTLSLTTAAMLNPWESLRVHAGRQMLFADAGGVMGEGGPEIDIYDLSADCRFPQLLSSTPLSFTTTGLLPLAKPIRGHEGAISPDGLTYYVGDLTNVAYHAIDVTNPTRPRLIASFDMLANSPIGRGPHGLSVSADGNRAYVTAVATPTAADVANPLVPATNGFIILDTSEVQQRKPGAAMKVISSVTFKDGSLAQHTIVTKINGKPHLVMVDEGGSGGVSDPASVKAACLAGMAPFPMARIYDISDEKKPVLVSKLGLETHDPRNCDAVLPDLAGIGIFTYGSHYCSVDDTENATAMACSYFNSGIRVFDIRNPAQPREIAYFNPAGTTLPPTGSDHVSSGQWRQGGPDWCASSVHFDKARGLLTTMCQDNGLIVLKFSNGVWPLN